MVLTRAQVQRKRTEFPFLKLPAELREEIYTLVLGGMTVHVGQLDHYCPSDTSCTVTEPPPRNKYRARHMIQLCSAKETDAEYYLERKKKGEFIPKRTVRRHRTCGESRIPKRIFNILQVCRQIYTEAALIPFSTNVFIFPGEKSLSRLCERLTIRQLQAVKTVHICQANGLAHWQQSLDGPMIAQMTRHVTVYVELAPRDMMLGRSDAALTPDDQDALLGAVSVLALPHLRSAKAMITGFREYREDYSPRPIRVLTNSELRAWERRIERMLLANSTITKAESEDNEDDSAAA